MIRRLSALIVLGALLASQSTFAQAPAVALAQSGLPVGTGIYDKSLDPKVEALLRKMTHEEKVGQLVQYSAGQPTGPGTGRSYRQPGDPHAPARRDRRPF